MLPAEPFSLEVKRESLVLAGTDLGETILGLERIYLFCVYAISVIVL